MKKCCVLPRAKKAFWAWLLPVLIMASPAFAHGTEPSKPFPDFVGFYQHYISAVDGDRCPMVPSCSEYMRICVKKHGIIMGWIMGADRLVRCGRDEVKTARPLWIKGRKYLADPVENNDFWWSEK